MCQAQELIPHCCSDTNLICQGLLLPFKTKSRDLLLAVKRDLKEQYWWKGKFALFWMLAKWGRESNACPKADHPPPPLTVSGQELF